MEKTKNAMKASSTAAKTVKKSITIKDVSKEYKVARDNMSSGKPVFYDNNTAGRNAVDKRSQYYKNNLNDWKARAAKGEYGFDTLDNALISHFAWTDKGAPSKVSEFARELATAVSQSKITKVSLSQDIGSPYNTVGKGFSDAEMNNLIKNLPSTVKSISIDGRFSESNLNTLLSWIEKHPGVDLNIETKGLQGSPNNHGKISAATFNRLAKACSDHKIASLHLMTFEDPNTLVGDKLLSPPDGNKEGYGPIGNVTDDSKRLAKLGKALGVKGQVVQVDAFNKKIAYIPKKRIARIREEGRNGI